MDIAFLGIRIKDSHVLFKVSSPCAHLAFGVKGEADAIKKHTVIATNLIHVEEGNIIFFGDTLEHIPLEFSFGYIIRGCRDIDEEIGPFFDHSFYRINRVTPP